MWEEDEEKCDIVIPFKAGQLSAFAGTSGWDTAKKLCQTKKTEMMAKMQIRQNLEKRN